jgi:hypothetical protein
MNIPEFTAQASLYSTSASYRGLAAGSDHLTGEVVTGGGWTRIFGSEVAWVKALGGWQSASCGALGKACCQSPFQNVPAFGPLVSCEQGLGCDITTGKCVSPCGGPGKPCCDGPQTRAPKWTADGRIYSPNAWNMQEMCEKGACDRQTHRCFACGTQDGTPCCPPDASQATARCVGRYLECEFNPEGFSVSGTCRACGSKGKPPCHWGCDMGLDIRNGLCDICGGKLQLPCDNGCKSPLRVQDGVCRSVPPPLQCGDEGQIPCAEMTCKANLNLNIDMFSNRLICTASCGHVHQYACRTKYAVPDGVRSRYRCFDHSKLFATGPVDPSNCLCVPNTINDVENDVSDNSGFCISTFPAPGDIADPPDCDPDPNTGRC